MKYVTIVVNSIKIWNKQKYTEKSKKILLY